MVLFVTGRCPLNCFYCPLSPGKKGKDLIYANERQVRSLNDVLEEAELMDAEGTGITGGEPLLVLERVLEIIRTLKARMGGSHHIHLYTCGEPFSLTAIKRLEEAGLDEIRFHTLKLRDLFKVERVLKETELEVGVEVPALPKEEGNLIKLVEGLEQMGAHFININELEFSEGNYMQLLERGFRLRKDSQVAAMWSKETALSVVEEAARRRLTINVHYCPAQAKDRLQTSLRLYRRGLNTARPHELVEDEGLIIKLKVEGGLPAIFSEVYGHVGEAHLDILKRLKRAGVKLKLVEELPVEPRLLISEESL